MPVWADCGANDLTIVLHAADHTPRKRSQLFTDGPGCIAGFKPKTGG
jgi:hypothetical protein